MTPRSREQLKEELGVRDIFEGLGNPEGLTAMECSFHRGHHIFADCCYVEIVVLLTGSLLPSLLLTAPSTCTTTAKTSAKSFPMPASAEGHGP